MSDASPTPQQIGNSKHWRSQADYSIKIDTSHLHIAFMTILLLLVVASRVRWLNQLAFDIDETRTAMRAMGTAIQTIQWQPTDWPPLYNVLIQIWQQWVSPHPIILRFSSLLLFLPAVPLSYQVGLQLFRSQKAGWSMAVVYAALGFSVYLSTYLRAYTLALTLLPLLLILTKRYFDKPTLWRGFALGLCIAVTFYTTYTAILAFGLVGLYSINRYGRAIWRWIPPVLLSFLLVLPELLYKASSFQDRLHGTDSDGIPLPPPGEYIHQFVTAVFGTLTPLWLIIALAAIVALFINRWRDGTRYIWVIIWVLAGPILLYIMIQQSLYLIVSPRYVWWVLLGIAILIGLGLVYLPRILWTAAILTIVVMMFIPFTPEDYYEKSDAYEHVLPWLADNMQSGDVIYMDPEFCWETCFFYDKWVYYGGIYLGDKMQVIDEVGNQRRIWYISQSGWNDEAAQATVAQGRVESIFVGPWDFLIQLYEAPPDPVGVAFANGLRFHGLQWVDENNQPLPSNLALIEQTTATARIWWSADEALTGTESVGLQLIADGQLLAQSDGVPQPVHLNPFNPTPLPADLTQWEPDKIYVELRQVEIPPLDDIYDAELFLTVYNWQTGERLLAEGVNNETLLPLDSVNVIGW